MPSRDSSQQTRSITESVEVGAAPERVFDSLVRPSAIRRWWGADRAVVIAQENGFWSAAWGAEEDRPDYVVAAHLSVFDPPRRLRMTEFRYVSKDGPLPFEAEFATEFTVVPSEGGSKLTVVQTGFPVASSTDDYYQGCCRGWAETCEGIRKFLAESA